MHKDRLSSLEFSGNASRTCSDSHLGGMLRKFGTTLESEQCPDAVNLSETSLIETTSQMIEPPHALTDIIHSSALLYLRCYSIWLIFKAYLQRSQNSDFCQQSGLVSTSWFLALVRYPDSMCSLYDLAMIGSQHELCSANSTLQLLEAQSATCISRRHLRCREC
jgi:hypothetical protein